VGLPLQESDKEKLLSFMIARRGGSRLLVVDNISATIMGGLAYINESIEIKQRLQLEINEYKFQNNLNPEDDVPLDDLRKLPYLDAIYWETLRIVSSASILVRNTSKDNTFKIKNSNNESVLHHVPRYAMLFSPLRSIHHDPKNWPNPLVFNPDNFYNVDPTRSRILRNKIFPFSIGMRVCPAQNGSIECAGKSIWVESLKHQFILDKKVETVPTDTIKSYWKDEYYAKLVPETRIDQTVSFSLTGIYR
jgi:cytochrome P450